MSKEEKNNNVALSSLFRWLINPQFGEAIYSFSWIRPVSAAKQQLIGGEVSGAVICPFPSDSRFSNTEITFLMKLEDYGFYDDALMPWWKMWRYVWCICVCE